MRTRVPFIEAFRNQQNGTTKAQPTSTEKVERDLTPKTMSDSYTKVVSHVIQSK
jgi:acyl-coenzyme A thioesterase 9